MKNLRNIECIDIWHSSDLPLTAATWDLTVENSQICAFGPTHSKPVIELKKVSQPPETPVPRTGDEPNGSDDSAVFSTVTSWDAPCPLPDLECDAILSLQHFSDVGIICLVLAGGDLVIVREIPLPGEEKIEIIGSIDVGISAASWSPDEELLAIATRSNTLLYMTRDFDQVSEVTLTSEDLKASKHVSVGWGKKETQFQGKRAKALRDPTMPETVDEGKASPFEDGRATISWRGDGAFVAINSVVSTDRRAIRIFSRDGTLDSVSEPVDMLESALSWRPSGNLIASVQRLDDRMDVIFFERNGLRHGQFTLRLSQEEMNICGSSIILAWNVDSTVLAVSMLDRVQLWTVGNYHYYLKQEINLCRHSLALNSTRWHPEKPLKLLLQAEDCLSTIDYNFSVSRGSTVPPDDFGITAVIDGCKVKLTPLRLAGVPPPMSLFELIVREAAVDCAISPRKQRVAVLTKRVVHCYRWDISKRPVPSPVLLDSMALPNPDEHVPRQILFVDDDELFILRQARQSESVIQFIRITSEGSLVTRNNIVTLHSPISYMFTDLWHKRLWWIETGRLRFLDKDFETTHESPAPYRHNVPSSSLVQTEAINLDRPLTAPAESGASPLDEDGRYVLFSLTKHGHLFAGERRISSNCTSFILTPSHLIFSTAQHLLKFVHLTIPDLLEVPGDTPEEDERCRNIERGARIINVMPSTYAVVLQMPRGNLETIYPRALVLGGIRKHMDEKDYHKAYRACRDHQVDTNILYDYRPEQFMSNLALFVKQLGKGDRIDDFLSKLKDEDVTKTLYQDTLRRSEGLQVLATDTLNTIAPKPNGLLFSPTDTDKVNKICNALLSVLDPTKHLRSIITAHVCKKPPDLEAGLHLVSNLLKSSSSDAESAISHLCFLTDPNTLYNVSISLYDLELTLLVAQQSQRDPREYLPYLRHLHSLEPLRRAFEIDNSLGYHAKALTSLHALSAHDEAEAYILKHHLFVHALDLYKYSPPNISLYTRHYAAHLASTSHPLQAAILYESLNDHATAYSLYALAHRWRESLSSALLSNPRLSQDQLSFHAISLMTTLNEETRDFKSAAEIASTHPLKDIPLAATLLCRGGWFSDAIRHLALHDLEDAIAEIVDTALATHFAETTNLLADCRAQLMAQVPRIAELRRKKAENPLAFFGGDPAVAAGGEGDVPDNLSIAPTDTSTRTGLGGTLVTRYTSGSRATSRSKRREERKKARGKRGSVYEEEYLVGSVKRLVDRVNAVGEEVGRLVEGLWRRGMRERALGLEEGMGETVRRCGQGVMEVWGVVDAERAGGSKDVVVGRPGGGEGVQWDAEMGTEVPGRPDVKAWRGSGIMD